MRSEPFRGRVTRRGYYRQMLPVGLNPQMGVVMKATLRYQQDCLYANRQSRSAQCKFENNDNRLRRGSLLALDQRGASSQHQQGLSRTLEKSPSHKASGRLLRKRTTGG